MKQEKVPWETLLLIGGGIFIILYTSKKAKEVVDSVKNSAPIRGTSKVIADAIVGATFADNVTVRGYVILPDGSPISIADNSIYINPDLMFSYSNKIYKIIGRTEDGNNFRSIYLADGVLR